MKDKAGKSKPKQSATHNDESQKVHDKLKALQRDRDELFEKLQRISADYANFQKRLPKQIADSVTYEKESIMRSLLPALDNLEHTLGSASSAESVEVLVKGIRIIYDQMLDILKSHQVEQINSVGEIFNPALHEAMTQAADPDKDEGIVLEEFQKGYKLNERVIRPSKVVVNNPSLAKQPDADTDSKSEQEQKEQ